MKENRFAERVRSKKSHVLGTVRWITGPALSRRKWLEMASVAFAGLSEWMKGAIQRFVSTIPAQAGFLSRSINSVFN